MKKKGFTLAEALITMIIIGIIATLTVPAIMSNVQKAQTGTGLMKAITDLDKANAIMLTEKGAYSIRSGCKINLDDDSDTIVDTYRKFCFDPYIKEKLGASEYNGKVSYTDFTGRSDAFATDQRIYTTKSGMSIIFDGYNQIGDTNLLKIYIDTNGINKKPNAYAKDLFILNMNIDDLGQIIPEGGIQMAELEGSGEPAWKDQCNETADGYKACAGSIVDNGGKVIYKWR